MRTFWIGLGIAVVAFGVPAGLCLSMLAGSAADPAAVLMQADRYYAALGWLKYALCLLLLGAGDYAVLRSGERGARRLAVLWAPFALFVAFGLVQWGFVGAAYLRFVQDYGIGRGAFSGPVLFMAVAYPAAFALSLVNHGLVDRRLSRTAR